MTPHVHRMILIANTHVWIGSRPNDARMRIANRVAAMDDDMGDQWARRILARWTGIDAAQGDPEAYTAAQAELAADEPNNHEDYLRATGHRDIRHAIRMGQYADLRLRNIPQAPTEAQTGWRKQYRRYK